MLRRLFYLYNFISMSIVWAEWLLISATVVFYASGSMSVGWIVVSLVYDSDLVAP
jgi:hypothetical protein